MFNFKACDGDCKQIVDIYGKFDSVKISRMRMKYENYRGRT